MPIRFEQPSPVGAAAAGGRTDARLQQRALDQRERLALAELYQRSAIANAQIAEQGAGRQSDMNALGLQIQAREAADAADLQRQQVANVGEVNAIHARIQGQMMLQEQELSQAERLRLSRMKSALAEVQSADWLTPEQKQAYSLELKTGINEYQQRNASMTVRLKEQAYNEAIEQSRIRAGVEAETAAFKAKTLPDRFVTKDIPGMGPVTFYEKSPGQYEMVQPPKSEAAISPMDLAKLHLDAEKAAVAQAKEEHGEGWATMPAEDKMRIIGEAKERILMRNPILSGANSGRPEFGGSSQPQPQQAGGQKLASPDDFLASIAARNDLRLEQKQAAKAALDAAQEILGKAGGDFSKLNDADKATIVKLKQFLDTLKAPPPPPPTAPRPAPSPSFMDRMGRTGEGVPSI